jgi:hypothetical protein
VGRASQYKRTLDAVSSPPAPYFETRTEDGVADIFSRLEAKPRRPYQISNPHEIALSARARPDTAGKALNLLCEPAGAGIAKRLNLPLMT